MFAQAGSHSGSWGHPDLPFGYNPHKPKGMKTYTEKGLQPRGDAIKRKKQGVCFLLSLCCSRDHSLYICTAAHAWWQGPTDQPTGTLPGIPFVPALNVRVSPMSSMSMLRGMNTVGRNGDSSFKVSRTCQEQHDWQVHIGRLFQVTVR